MELRGIRIPTRNVDDALPAERVAPVRMYLCQVAEAAAQQAAAEELALLRTLSDAELVALLEAHNIPVRWTPTVRTQPAHAQADDR